MFLCIPFLLIVPTASSLPLQGSNLQSQHILSSHSTLASRYPPGSSTSNIDTSVPGPGGTYISQPHYPENHSCLFGILTITSSLVPRLYPWYLFQCLGYELWQNKGLWRDKLPSCILQLCLMPRPWLPSLKGGGITVWARD